MQALLSGWVVGVSNLVMLVLGAGLLWFAQTLWRIHQDMNRESHDYFPTCDCARCLNWRYQSEGR